MNREHRPSSCPDPAISVAMLKMLDAIEAYPEKPDASALAYQSAHLVGTVRRCLATSGKQNLHRDLWLSSALEDYARRWNSSAVIGGHFDLFQRDSRRMMAMIDEGMCAQGVTGHTDAA